MSRAAVLSQSKVGELPEWRRWAPVVVAALAFALLFWDPMRTLARDWWSDPEAGHGLLLGPLALFLAWKKGLGEDRRSQPLLGAAILLGAVVLRYLSGAAAELFTMRMSLMFALFGLVVYAWGFGQLRRWWLSAALLVLAVPLPAVILTTLAFPLQLQASEIGAALLEARYVPVFLAGNVIHLPGGHSLFVTEACSGLRSLTALVSLGVLIGGLWLGSPFTRILLLALTVPVAILINGFRVFLTGFLVFHVSPELGEGFMHMSEGWAMFVIAFLVLGGMAWVLVQLEGAVRRRFA